MSKIEEILKESTKFSSERIFNKLPVYDAMQQTALAFTKWKDENYELAGFGVYALIEASLKHGLSQSEYEVMFKTLEQLFDEWNNLKK